MDGTLRQLLSIGSIVLIVGITAVACGRDGGSLPDIEDARVAQPTGPNTALYFTASGASDRLIGAQTDAASSVEIHRSIANNDGTMGMEHVEYLELPDDDDLVLEPGGDHLMLIDVADLDVGNGIEVTLRWENAGDQVLTRVEVVSPADVMVDS